jgi:hypothetical protein
VGFVALKGRNDDGVAGERVCLDHGLRAPAAPERRQSFRRLLIAFNGDCHASRLDNRQA